METLKKKWQIILIVVLVMFGFTKCTQSCNRASKISKLTDSIIKQDSNIKAKTEQINALTRDTADYMNQIRMYSKFGKQTDEYIRQRNMTDSINAVNSAKQKAQTDALIRQNRELMNKNK